MSDPIRMIDRVFDAGPTPSRHHTKDKGDVGVACVVADLMKKGIQVALPLSEHLPFDLLAISADGEVAKISVKYRALNKLGTIKISAESTWADRHGTHRRRHRAGDYDAVAIYCPDSDECYYVLAMELCSRETCLRILEPKNRQVSGVRMAGQFTDPSRVFTAPVAQRIEHVASNHGGEGSSPSWGTASDD